jgi:hypothetical protein
MKLRRQNGPLISPTRSSIGRAITMDRHREGVTVKCSKSAATEGKCLNSGGFRSNQSKLRTPATGIMFRQAPSLEISLTIRGLSRERSTRIEYAARTLSNPTPNPFPSGKGNRSKRAGSGTGMLDGDGSGGPNRNARRVTFLSSAWRALSPAPPSRRSVPGRLR